MFNYFKYSIWCKKEYEEVIKGGVQNSDVFVIGLTFCPWTIRTMNFFKVEYGITPKLIAPDILGNEYKVEMLRCMCKETNKVETAQIWIKGNHIGHFGDVLKLHKKSKIEI